MADAKIEQPIETVIRSVVSPKGVYMHSGDFIKHLKACQGKGNDYSTLITAIQEWVAGIANKEANETSQSP